MKDQTLHRIRAADFLHKLNSLRAVTVHPAAEDLRKFRDLAAVEGMTPEQCLISLIAEFIEARSEEFNYRNKFSTQPRPKMVHSYHYRRNTPPLPNDNGKG